MSLLHTAALAAGVLGVLIGSFLNVVIYRVPRRESLLFPASHCPECSAPIRPWQNVPLVSWLALRGRCAACDCAISPRYPLVELGTGVLFAALTLRVGVSAYLPGCLFLVAIGITLAMIDLDGEAVPSSFALAAGALAAGLLLPAGAADAVGTGLRHLGWSLAGAVALAAAYAVLAVTSHHALDPGLALVSGLVGLELGWLSWQLMLVAVAGSLAAGLAVGCATGAVATTTGRRITPATLPIGMLVLGTAGLVLVLPLPFSVGG